MCPQLPSGKKAKYNLNILVISYSIVILRCCFIPVLLFMIVVVDFFQGSAAESKFVKPGANVSLDVKKPVVFTPVEDIFFWKFNRTLDIFRSEKNKTNTKIYPTYDGRVVVLENFSLVLENVHERDAGLYTAVLSGKDNKVAEYQLHIQGMSLIEKMLMTQKVSSAS